MTKTQKLYLVFCVLVILTIVINYVWQEREMISLQNQIREAELNRLRTLMEISKDLGIPIDNILFKGETAWAIWSNATYGEFLRVAKVEEKWQILDVYYFYGGGSVYKAETNESRWTR